MPPEDHHHTPEQIRACPICQMLMLLRAKAIVARIRSILRGGE